MPTGKTGCRAEHEDGTAGRSLRARLGASCFAQRSLERPGGPEVREREAPGRQGPPPGSPKEAQSLSPRWAGLDAASPKPQEDLESQRGHGAWSRSPASNQGTKLGQTEPLGILLSAPAVWSKAWVCALIRPQAVRTRKPRHLLPWATLRLPRKHLQGPETGMADGKPWPCPPCGLQFPQLFSGLPALSWLST